MTESESSFSNNTYESFTAGMGNFDSDEGQHFFSFIPRDQIINPRPHTFYTVLLNFIFIEKNERIIRF